jgi:regulator of PEP synthase PpsR (kinase-PPPase family)
MKTIILVSDGTGARGHHLLRAALAQFPADLEVEIRIRPRVRTAELVDKALDEACASDAVLVHTLAPSELRNRLLSSSTERGVAAIDLFGPLLTGLGHFLETRPGGVPGGVVQHGEDSRWVDALTFAVKHDDGLGMKDIGRADIVLVGVSRTSKTPLSVYLATRGYRVMNVPIVPEVGVPPELFKVDPRHVVGLRVEPERLQQLRENRLKAYGRAATKRYTDIEHIRNEVAAADDLFQQSGWLVVDVTDRAVEEAAVDVVRLTSASADTAV